MSDDNANWTAVEVPPDKVTVGRVTFGPGTRKGTWCQHGWSPGWEHNCLECRRDRAKAAEDREHRRLLRARQLVVAIRSGQYADDGDLPRVVEAIDAMFEEWGRG